MPRLLRYSRISSRLTMPSELLPSPGTLISSQSMRPLHSISSAFRPEALVIMLFHCAAGARTVLLFSMKRVRAE